ncbi:hypothetical protein [Ilumatobacter sp.]|uniref:hypothetical protein n=1 Tax=Ilumatobacter sp. TaxID=1967498 RepID=UPI003C5B1AD8
MITIPTTHNGPPHSAHGGVAAGRMAELLDSRRARVRFHSPPPLDEPLTTLERPLESIEVFAGSRHVATVSPTAPLDVEPFKPHIPMAVAVAESRWLDRFEGDHPFPTCFGCGPARRDGLGLAPGPVPGSSTHATFWAPDVDGPVPTWMVWAALDCPSGGPALTILPTGSMVVTGELAVDIARPLAGREQYQILSRCSGRSGRKITTEAAIVDSAGRNVAIAEATWIAIASESALAS